MCFLGMKLTMSYCLICVFALLINKAFLQAVNVAEGVTGGSVVLPCATSETKHNLSEIAVQWRHNDDLPVYGIIKGKFSLQDQDLTYKNRVESFPTEYERGNFSIKLNNLTHADAGDYLCFIQHSVEVVITQLIIKVPKGEHQTAENKNQARETHSRMILPTVLLLFSFCCV